MRSTTHSGISGTTGWDIPGQTFTTIEGTWDECMAVVKQAVDAIGAYGSRVSLVLKADIFSERAGELGKLRRLEQLEA